MNVREQPPSLGWRCGRGARSSRAMKKAAKQIAADKRRLTQIENKEAKSVLSALIGVYLRLNCVFQQPAKEHANPADKFSAGFVQHGCFLRKCATDLRCCESGGGQ